MPVANMQSFRSVALRVHSSAFAAQGQAMQLESSVLAKLHQACSFEQIMGAQAAHADVILDLNVTNAGRGGGGIISNSSTARLDTLLVISDGESGDLLGTARIHGESSGMIINNAPPENEAIDVVAKAVADMFVKSGCTGPRVAKVVPPPPEPLPPTEAKPDETHRAEAEKLNEDGKQKLFVADIQGAIAAFQQANALLPDARYEYNVCSALGAAEQWDNAIAACKQARTLNPQPALVAKIDHKIDLLQHHQ
jgi:tetratricopeptide (TPR) repeat protein